MTFFKPDRRLSTISSSDLTAYVSHRREAGASAASCNLELAIVKRAFKLALRAKEVTYIPHIPMAALANARQGFFAHDQFLAVRTALPAHLRGLASLCYFTGWRRSEVLPLQWSQIDRERHVIRLEVGSTKSGAGRTLPYGQLPELVTVVTDAWTEHERLTTADVICPYVFHRNGKPIRDFRKSWDQACTTAGCPGKLLHDFRRSAVRNLVRAGVPEKIAMGISGHKTRSVFDRYDIIREEDLRDALGKLSGTPAPAASSGKVQAFKARRR